MILDELLDKLMFMAVSDDGTHTPHWPPQLLIQCQILYLFHTFF